MKVKLMVLLFMLMLMLALAVPAFALPSQALTGANHACRAAEETPAQFPAGFCS